MLTRLFFFLSLAFCCQLPVVFCQLPFVNPFIGTGGHGHTYPGATAPFGLVQLSPDTRIDMMDWDGCSGYHYSDSIIYGFSHTHLSGTGVADYCDILFMPYTGGAELEPKEYASKFKKSKEKAEAGYYSVFLEKDKILAELTATERVGVHRYTFPGNRERGHILVDLRHRDEVLDSYMKRVSNREIEGYRISKGWAKEQHVYFVARFSRPFSGSKILDMSKSPRETDPAVQSKAIVGLLDFFNEDDPLVVTVGISGVSIEGARKNLEAECAHFDFEKIKAETQAKWQRQLSKIEVEGGTDDQKTIFYTALYHTMIAPNIWNDVDGQYRGRDNKTHPNPGHDVYTVFSLWDTYRALHPLHTILEPKRTNDFIQTFLRQYEQGGLLPVWELSANETDCMIGNHAIPVIVDAYSKGIRDFDINIALKAMEANTMQNRLGQFPYRFTGFISSEQEPESVSKTLEYAFDDWCIAQMGKFVGNENVYKTYIRRAQNYKNMFDPFSKFFRARSNGGWYAPFDPYEVNFNYTEANAWQYRFAAPQDVSGMMRLLGGREIFASQLDSLFLASTKTSGRNQADITGLIGQYVHGNEPSHHIAYLYNYVGQPWKTQLYVRQIMDQMYANRPDGLSGNEDCGQMSAWFVMSAMGFYPVVPGSVEYIIGTPLFEKITLHLDNSKTFVVNAPGVSSQNKYVKNADLNGKSYSKNWFSHKTLTDGGSLKFEMTSQPSKWSSEESNLPVSEITDELIVPAPFLLKGERVFQEKQTIGLGCADKEAELYYSFFDPEKMKKANPDNSITIEGIPFQTTGEPAPKPRRYTKPIAIEKTIGLSFFAEKNGNRGETAMVSAVFNKIQKGLGARYNTRYSPQYTARGDNGLIDGIRGGADFRTGDWQGFEGVNLDLVIDLSKSQTINKITAGFMQDENAWVFFPTKMQVEISDDGQNFTPAGEVICDIAPTEKGVLQKDFVLDLKGKKARYVRVVGVSLGKCPDWHKGAGYPCWVFVDEISIE
ncbi:MAG: GH92 family glycosyl hydrolase [Saprospiraceae bacterium]